MDALKGVNRAFIVFTSARPTTILRSVMGIAWISKRASSATVAALLIAARPAHTGAVEPSQVSPATSFADLKYRPPSSAEVDRNRRKALDWATQARETIAPSLHLVETAHFLVFSTWNPSTDAALAQVCERMYQSLVRQFDLQSAETVWVGKCPVYIFLDATQYLRFASEIDRRSARQKNLRHTVGYHATQNGFAYVVLNGARERGDQGSDSASRFFEVLVHEGSHAFLDRYVSPRPVPTWIDEGLAEYMAATLTPGALADASYVEATRRALKGTYSLTDLFQKKDLTPQDYGVAQSVVRYLLATDNRAFARFIARIKNGTTWETALRETYRGTPAELERSWRLFWRRKLSLGS